MSDENQTEPDLVEAIQSGDPLRALLGLRDYIAHELDGQRCNKCQMSQLKAGDQASLILRLQQILKEIEHLLPSSGASVPGAPGGKVTSLSAIRGQRNAIATGERELGTKKAQRRRGVNPK